MDDETVTRQALAAQAGDRAAAAAFIRATTEPVTRLLRYLTEPGQLDDLVQETYLRAFAALPRYRQQAPARLWLLSIARRVAADHVRTARRRPRTSSGDWDHDRDARRHTPAATGMVELRAAIAALEPDQRDAFVLTRVLGLSYAEAAEICGCPIGTIRSRVYRARGELRATLTDHDTPTRSADTPR